MAKHEAAAIVPLGATRWTRAGRSAPDQAPVPPFSLSAGARSVHGERAAAWGQRPGMMTHMTKPRRTLRQRRAWARWEASGGPAALRAELARAKQDPFAPGIGQAPESVPGTPALRLTLRTYLEAVAAHGDDTARALAGLGVATRAQVMTYTMVALDSGLVDIGGRLTVVGHDVLRAMSRAELG